MPIGQHTNAWQLLTYWVIALCSWPQNSGNMVRGTPLMLICKHKPQSRRHHGCRRLWIHIKFPFGTSTRYPASSDLCTLLHLPNIAGGIGMQCHSDPRGLRSTDGSKTVKAAACSILAVSYKPPQDMPAYVSALWYSCLHGKGAAPVFLGPLRLESSCCCRACGCSCFQLPLQLSQPMLGCHELLL